MGQHWHTYYREGKGPFRRRSRPPVIELPMDEIAERYLAGESSGQIAKSFSAHAELVRKRLLRMGIVRRMVGARPGKLNHQWKGTYQEPMHYYRRQSYEIAAICLGKPLPQGSVIHHLDENPKNNAPENLVIFQKQGLHARMHRKQLSLQKKGQQVDATQSALESGGLLLQRPASLLEWIPDISQ